MNISCNGKPYFLVRRILAYDRNYGIVEVAIKGDVYVEER